MNQETVYAPRYTVADMFSGCGGLSLGFTLTRRFETLLGVDIKPEALEIFAYNHELFGGQRPMTILDDIANVESRAFIPALQASGADELDCLIGGPPCEGFSQNRTVQDGKVRTHKFIDDPRNHLFRWFVDLAAALQPKVVLLENVPDLVRHKDGDTLNEILTALDTAGYTTTVRVLNAADYGVPQMRRRAFFLAQRKKDLARTGFKLKLPEPTHKSYPLMHKSLLEDPNWLPGDSGYWVNVREALGDLPIATTDENGISTSLYCSSKMTTFRALMRSSRSVIFNHRARQLGKNGLKRLQALRPGQICEDLPEELRPKGHYHNSYTRLLWSEPARTITKFVYHVGSGQFGHPEEDRAVTIREAARLQSFPDDFKFVGINEIRKVSALVGSAVPPLVARAIAREIVQYLDQLYLINMKPEDRRAVKVLTGDAVMRRLEYESWNSEELLASSNSGQLTLF
ncbi:MAG TPA: DNA cytosine methyltransferase [Ktedonobacteraceae bacterium]